MNIPSPSPEPDGERREKAYEAGARMARERIAREAPLDAEALASVEAADVVVISGVYDRVHLVLDALEMPFTPLEPWQLAHVRLHPEQLLVVNCPGQFDDPQALQRIGAFVEAGGSLFTTDWALEHVVQRAFPGTVAHGGRDTRDDVVPIEVLEHDNPFLQGVMDGADEPVWWLEGASYPIRVLDPERVRVLVSSRELGRRYGESPVAVLFDWGAGEVFHMISHYYLQRTELRSARQGLSGAAYWTEKGVPVPQDLEGDLDELRLGEVEAAATSSRLIANVVAAKKRRATAAAREGGEGR